MKKLIAIASIALSLSAMASTFNCKSTDSEFYNFDFTIKVQGETASLKNNTTGTLDKCEALIDGNMQIVQCNMIVIGISNEQLDIDGGNTVYQTADGARGFMKCASK